MADQDPINPDTRGQWRRRRRQPAGRRRSPNISRICRSRTRTRRRSSSGRPSRSSTSSSTSTATRSADDVHEVMLKIEVTAKSDSGTHFIIELSYAGLFGFRNIPEEALPPFLLAEAPRLLFPFARQIIAEAVQNGGFPPLLLDPIDFAAPIWRRSRRQQQAKASRAATGRDATGRPTPDAAQGAAMNLYQGDRHDRRPDHGQPRARLRPRHDRFAACSAPSHGSRRLQPRLPAPQPVPPAVRRRRVPSGFVPLFSRACTARAGMRRRRRFAERDAGGVPAGAAG